MTKSLDLGCGSKPRNFFNAKQVYGIDIRDDLEAGIYKADLVIEPIPFSDCTFDFVTAHDFLEHIPRIIYNPSRRNSFVEIMNEIWRVLKVGGQFLSVTPAYPNSEAFRDPTHVNIITEETFSLYFDNINCLAKMYGFYGSFLITDQKWNGPHLITLLTKLSSK
jgi:SAM-dependent methyltransferase